MNLKHMIPFLEEAELNELAEKIMESPDGSFQDVTISNLLPFLEEEEIDKLVSLELEKGHPVDMYMPFMSDEAYHAIASSFIKGNPVPNIVKWIPFLEDEDVDAMARKVITEGGSYDGLSIDQLLPFIDDDVLDEAFKEAFKNGDEASLKRMAPFASEDVLHETAEAYSKGEGNEACIDILYPFFEDEDIRLLFKRAMAK